MSGHPLTDVFDFLGVTDLSTDLIPCEGQVVVDEGAKVGQPLLAQHQFKSRFSPFNGLSEYVRAALKLLTATPRTTNEHNGQKEVHKKIYSCAIQQTGEFVVFTSAYSSDGLSCMRAIRESIVFHGGCCKYKEWCFTVAEGGKTLDIPVGGHTKAWHRPWKALMILPPLESTRASVTPEAAERAIAQGTLYRTCSYCEYESRMLIECSGCGKAWYCDRKCKNNHWEGGRRKTAHSLDCDEARANIVQTARAGEGRRGSGAWAASGSGSSRGDNEDKRGSQTARNSDRPRRVSWTADGFDSARPGHQSARGSR